jgi:hypothetical protein
LVYLQHLPPAPGLLQSYFRAGALPSPLPN